MPIEAPACASQSVRFLDIDFSALSFEEVVATTRTLSKGERFSFIVTPNVDHVVNLNPREPSPRSSAFRAAYDAAALRLCDSRILHVIGRRFGVELPIVTGSDLTVRLFNGFFTPDDKVAIIGGRVDTIPRLSTKFPGPRYVQHLPPMGVLENVPAQNAITEFIAAEAPDFTLFAIGAPQSEIVAHRCAEMPLRGVGLCIGASIDFLLGDRKRAPIWMQKSGLEWAFRLGSEPARLWRRYLIDGPRIFIIALRHRRKGPNSPER